MMKLFYAGKNDGSEPTREDLMKEIQILRGQVRMHKNVARKASAEAAKAREEAAQIGRLVSKLQHSIFEAMDKCHAEMPGVFEPGQPEYLGSGC